MPRPSKYPEEFRKDAVALVLASPQRTVVEIARELGVNRETLRLWVKAAQAGQTTSAGGPGSGEVSGAEGEELRRGWVGAGSGGWRGRFCGRQPPILPRRWVVDSPLPVHLRTLRPVWRRAAVPRVSGHPSAGLLRVACRRVGPAGAGPGR